ncbi:hypothetical protein KKF91_19210 [Myxococcota bacterium]|nr:hypothetical protein [Myxococcota bacterium]
MPLEPPLEPPDLPPDAPDGAHRLPLDALMERAIGHAAKRVRFNWREGDAQLGAHLSLPAELNNFESLRAGARLRVPTSGLLLELGLSYAWVWSTPSTDLLALTPYRQAGRPARFELDLGLAYPLAEGVATPAFSLLPAVELTFTAHAQLRYLFYPGSTAGMDLKDTLTSWISGTLSDEEVDNLEGARLPGMLIDRARYVALLGLGNDLYFQSGLLLSHRVLLATPLLGLMLETQMNLGVEWDLCLGWAF